MCVRVCARARTWGKHPSIISATRVKMERRVFAHGVAIASRGAVLVTKGNCKQRARACVCRCVRECVGGGSDGVVKQMGMLPYASAYPRIQESLPGHHEPSKFRRPLDHGKAGLWPDARGTGTNSSTHTARHINTRVSTAGVVGSLHDCETCCIVPAEACVVEAACTTAAASASKHR